MFTESEAYNIYQRCKLGRIEVKEQKAVTIHPADKKLYDTTIDQIDNAFREIAIIISRAFPSIKD